MNDVTVDPEILGGIPVFAGTRVPVQALVDHLRGGESIEDFLEGFPSVRREQVLNLLQQFEEHVTHGSASEHPAVLANLQPGSCTLIGP